MSPLEFRRYTPKEPKVKTVAGIKAAPPWQTKDIL
jgi:hypothetical protein